MKSILGQHQLNVEGQNLVVDIIQADGIPEAGHFRYSMVVKQEDFKPYAVTFDGYESNRIVLEYNSVFDDEGETEDLHLELEAAIIREALLSVNEDSKKIASFFNCESFKMVEGSLVEMN